MAWIIQTYQGAGPVTFGMSSATVAGSLGAPTQTIDDSATSKRESRGEGFPILHYENDELTEIVLSPDVKDVFFDGLDVFLIDPLDFLKHLSSKFRDCKLARGGTIISLGAGIAMSGFHDNFKEQKSINAFVRGIWSDAVLRRAADVSY